VARKGKVGFRASGGVEEFDHARHEVGTQRWRVPTTFDGPQLDVATAVAALVVTTHVGFFGLPARVESSSAPGSGTMAQWLRWAQVSLGCGCARVVVLGMVSPPPYL